MLTHNVIFVKKTKNASCTTHNNKCIICAMRFKKNMFRSKQERLSQFKLCMYRDTQWETEYIENLKKKKLVSCPFAFRKVKRPFCCYGCAYFYAPFVIL